GNNTTIICSGNGIVVCPKPLISKVLQKNNDKIAEKIHRAIDDGFTNGEFVFEAFACTWKDGEKYTVRDRGHAVPVYNYHLDIEWDNDTLKAVNDLSIKAFQNPVQNRLTVEFSMPINDMVNIKIIDAEVSLHWQSETYVSDDTYTLPESVIHALKPGTYLIICTKDDAMISATFVKQ
ncbi:MAG: hypothetical protein LBH82_06230, partial [Bacteroidales bacterium]|nr:hypothetical protein [Bacteroidales bacterium]